MSTKRVKILPSWSVVLLICTWFRLSKGAQCIGCDLLGHWSLPCIRSETMKDSQETFYAICVRWLRPKYVITVATEAENVFQTSIYDGERKWWNWEKYISNHVKHHVALVNPKNYECQGLNLGIKIHHFCCEKFCDKLSSPVVITRVNPTITWRALMERDQQITIVLHLLCKGQSKSKT